MFRALDMLEAELATICPMERLLPQTYRGNQEQDLHKLRLLLERECAAQVSATTRQALVSQCVCAVYTGTCTSSMYEHQLVSMQR